MCKMQQVLAYVVVEDSHEAHVAVVGTVSGQCGSPAGALGNDTVGTLGDAGAILPGGWDCNGGQRENLFVYWLK